MEWMQIRGTEVDRAFRLGRKAPRRSAWTAGAGRAVPMLLAACLFGACFQESTPEATAEVGVEPTAGKPRPFDVYLGRAPTRVYSKSEIHSPRSRHVIESVLQGDVVHHEILITNNGQQPMEIRKLRMCSGCMLDGYSKSIEPGHQGQISLVIPTDALGGRRIDDAITFETTAADLPEVRIDISLVVREFASVSPYRVWLKGSSKEEIVETCVITPNEDHPFSITAIRPRKGIWFSHSIDEVEREGRKAYLITIKNTRTKPGSYQDILFIQTDRPERPEFKVRIEGRIHE